MKKLLFVALALLLSVLLTACTLPPIGQNPDDGVEPKNRIFYEYFDTVCTFYDYTGGTDEEFKQRYLMIDAELKACHELFDIYHTYEGINNIKTVNDAAGGEPVKVDERLIELLEFSREMYDKTDGNVNVMMGSVLSIWHKHRTGIQYCAECDTDRNALTQEKDGKKVWYCSSCGAENVHLEVKTLPDMDKLRAAAEHTDISSLEINSDEGTVRISDGDASLDVGAIAKGFVAERIAKMLENTGVYAYALDLGGNLRVGEKLSGEGWQGAIRNPELYTDEPYIRMLEVKNEALVTSGSYERFYTVDGVRYHHIINKDTLMPENRYASVSILTPSSAVADALSTALFNMSEEEIERTLVSFPETEVTLVYPDGRVEIIESGE